MSQTKFVITHLYPEEMAIYGDMGNIHAMRWTLEKAGVEIEYIPISRGNELPDSTCFYFIGGGQDGDQLEIYDDFLNKVPKIKSDINNGVPLLAICGGYQLLGHSFTMGDGSIIKGGEVFPVETKAPSNAIRDRCVGNLAVSCNIPELQGVTLVGFENHSGQTRYIEDLNQIKSYPLGNVLHGNGNTRSGKTEGCVYLNAVGSYLHGSCLPKNPELTNFFIHKGLESKGMKQVKLPAQNIALKAKDSALSLLSM